MTLATLADLDVLSGRLVLPRSGVAFAELELGGDALDVGRADLTIAGDEVDDVVFVGCVARVALVEARIHAFWVAGVTGALSRSPLGVDLPARHYDGDPTPVSAWELLSDLCAESGESLDASQRSALEVFTATSWLRDAGPAHRALSRIVGAWGLSARFNPSGSLWVGVDAFAAADDVRAVDPIDDGFALYVAPFGATIQPGTSVNTKDVLRVEYLIGDALRARLHYSEGP